MTNIKSTLLTVAALLVVTAVIAEPVGPLLIRPIWRFFIPERGPPPPQRGFPHQPTPPATDNDWLWADWLPRPSPTPAQEQKKSLKGNRPIYDYFILPPEEFDREYTGDLVIKRFNAEGIKLACQGVSWTACSFRGSDKYCTIYIADDNVLNQHLLSYDAVFRHERAHCLGWHHADESKRRY